MPLINCAETPWLYSGARAPFTREAVGRDSPVFFTNEGASAGGATSISFVSVGREFGAFIGRDEVRGLVLSVGGVAGWFTGWLDPVVTTRCRSWAAAVVEKMQTNANAQTDRYEIFFENFKTYCSLDFFADGTGVGIGGWPPI